MSAQTLAILQSALASMGSDVDSVGPQPLEDELRISGRRWHITIDAAQIAQICDLVVSDDVNDVHRTLFARYLRRWDHFEPSWAAGTSANTVARRARVYDLLEVTEDWRARCDQVLPPRTDSEDQTIIAEEHEEWYDAQRTQDSGRFYWDAYAKYLGGALGWPEESVIDLDESTHEVIARLSDPRRSSLHQVKGLVVGYVQSGKTANFTAVIAKAADAGYRLIIVLAGVLDILRQQTQRRVDKELIGKELLAGPNGDPGDYGSDREWTRFIEHGARPSELGSFDWQRLTGAKDEYRSLHRGIDALEFEKVSPGRRFNDPVNLRAAKCRLVVVKKNPAVLKRLAKDLASIRTRLDQVPALVIDDESDQASINTYRQSSKKRTSTNRQIVELLKALPRAQYVGYTATPFANVFIDPADAEDLFPRDFILPLRKPVGYMGVSDFYDLGETIPEGSLSNERAFVRDVRGDDLEPGNLLKALDSFILSGAIKLFRSASTGQRFSHHTMLIHRSQRMSDHKDDANLVRDLFARSGYRSGDGFDRLQTLFANDFAPVTATRSEGQPTPDDFVALEPFIAKVLDRLGGPEAAVAVVNGDVAERAGAPDFDREEVWRILVGGTKLSRGYTVEGLTVSYYRRPAKAADTLMQMGRWFGFRRGYRDLVRLFIGRAEGVAELDLYAAFKGICLDEEQFREQLKLYSKQREPRVTPKQIPPLVPSHLLRPTAANKMYNAVLVAQNFSEKWVEPTLAPTSDDVATKNATCVARMFLAGQPVFEELVSSPQDSKPYSMHAAIALVSHQAMVETLRKYEWQGKVAALASTLGLFTGQMGDPQIEDWLVIAPQISEAEASGVWQVGTHALRVVNRSRHQDGSERYKAFTEPRHRKVAEGLIGVSSTDMNGAARKYLKASGRGVMLLYPCRDKALEPEGFVTPGFALLVPKNNLVQQIAFTVRDASRLDDVVVTGK